MDKINTNPSINTNISTNSGGFAALKKPGPYYIAIFLIALLIIVTYLIFFNINIFNSPSKSHEQDTFMILSYLISSILIVFLVTMFLPGLAEFKNIFIQIGNVTYVILFTLATILFYTLVSKDILSNYSKYINPIILVLGIYAFYKSILTDYIGKFNINYERIKMLIILVCFIALSITFYSVNPGNMASNYFGYSLLLTSILGIFAFLYVILLLTMSDGWSIESPVKSGNILSKFSPFGVYGSAFFLIFLMIVTYLISNHKKDFFANPAKSSSVIILVLLISVIWITMLCANLFSDSPLTANNFLDMTNVGFYKKALLAIFGLIILKTYLENQGSFNFF